MADKVDMKPAASSLLPVAVEKKKQKQAPPPSPAVQMVSEWALRTGVIFAVSFALACCAAPFQLQPSWLLLGVGEAELTGGAAAEERAIRRGVPWSTAAQVAAAALALLLPAADSFRRSRLALAHVALAAAVATHLMLARVITLFLAANPGGIFWWTAGVGIILYLAAGDINCAKALLGRGAHANVPAAC